MSAGEVIGDRAVTARIRALASDLPARVLRTVTEFALDVKNAATRNAPIKKGRLRRSIHPEVTQQGGQISGVVGSNVEYAAIIEHGFKGAQSVRSFVRKQTMAWGHPIAPTMVSVRPFTRNVDRPARPFLAPALADMRPTLSERLRADLAAVKGTA